MSYKEILEKLEQIHNNASIIEQEIKPYALENEGLKCMLDELFNTIEDAREPLFDLVSGKEDKL